MEYKIINYETGMDKHFTNEAIAQFLVQHLEAFGDKIEDVRKCLAYVMHPEKGGHIIVGLEEDTIVGAAVLNKTGMQGYIPENILVYIAVDKNRRGKGYGKLLMKQAIACAQGGIALHVEPDNPAKQLYEKLGFTNKYLEMRLQR